MTGGERGAVLRHHPIHHIWALPDKKELASVVQKPGHPGTQSQRQGLKTEFSHNQGNQTGGNQHIDKPGLCYNAVDPKKDTFRLTVTAAKPVDCFDDCPVKFLRPAKGNSHGQHSKTAQENNAPQDRLYRLPQLHFLQAAASLPIWKAQP